MAGLRTPISSQFDSKQLIKSPNAIPSSQTSNKQILGFFPTSPQGRVEGYLKMIPNIMKVDN